MSDTPPLPLEQGTALSLLWETADDMRQSAADLHAAADAHAMSAFAFVRDTADGGAPDPSGLLRSRGRYAAHLLFHTCGAPLMQYHMFCFVCQHPRRTYDIAWLKC